MYGNRLKRRTVVFDAYIRVSRLGERSEEEATEVYEAQLRKWADRHGLELDIIAEDTDVSGAVAVAERKLERLVQRIEAGESEDILTPYLDRFGRDLIEGALAYRRIKLAGGRLVCVNDGTDSSREGDELVFQVRMAIAEDYLRRIRAGFKAAQQRAVKRGCFVGGKAPLGYRRDEERRLVRDEPAAALVQELFTRAGAGDRIRGLHGYLAENGVEMTAAGVRKLLRNRVYLGEATVPGERNGDPDVIKDHHDPIVTEAQWEAAQQIRGVYNPRTGETASARLRGLVHCGSCGKRCRLMLYGPPDRRRVQYACENRECERRASIRAALVDPYVDDLLMHAILTREPHVAAIIEGDTRYADAQAAVEDARRDYEEFRDSIEMQRTLGISSFARGLKVRKEALALARRELRMIRPEARPAMRGEVTLEEFLREEERARYLRFIERVVIHSARKNRHVPVHERAEVWFVGADAPAPAHVWTQEQLDWAAQIRVASAEELKAHLEELAAKGDQSARDYRKAKTLTA
jgi:DNA invertase Pin-like site-specific DNA recombinase